MHRKSQWIYGIIFGDSIRLAIHHFEAVVGGADDEHDSSTTTHACAYSIAGVNFPKWMKIMWIFFWCFAWHAISFLSTTITLYYAVDLGASFRHIFAFFIDAVAIVTVCCRHELKSLWSTLSIRVNMCFREEKEKKIENFFTHSEMPFCTHVNFLANGKSNEMEWVNKRKRAAEKIMAKKRKKENEEKRRMKRSERQQATKTIEVFRWFACKHSRFFFDFFFLILLHTASFVLPYLLALEHNLNIAKVLYAC